MHLKNRDNLLAAALYLIYAFAAYAHSFEIFEGIMSRATPFFLFTVNSLLLFLISRQGRKNLFVAAGAFLFTYATEAVGVNTGLLYGSYSYSGVLGLSVFGVPLIIGLNWVMIVLGAYSLMSIITDNRIIASFYTSVIAVYLDILIEPTAIKLNYWQWKNGAIPFYNYVTWFFVAFAVSLLFSAFKIRIKNRIPVHYLACQFIFFIILYVIN